MQPFYWSFLTPKQQLISGIIAIVIFVVLLALVWMKKSKKEHLENVASKQLAPVIPVQEVVPAEKAHAMERKVEEIPIKPQVLDAGSGTIMAGSELVPAQLLSPWYKAYTGEQKNHYLLDDGADGAAGLQFNMCSKSCCGEQYPLPFKMPVDSAVCDNKQEFVPSNYMCNNAWQDSGCVCMTKGQSELLGSRGGNA